MSNHMTWHQHDSKKVKWLNKFITRKMEMATETNLPKIEKERIVLMR